MFEGLAHGVGGAAWLITLLAFVFMYPWARWLLGRTNNYLLTGLVTFALGVGTLSLVMLWIGLIGLRIDWRLAVLLCAAISGSGVVVLRRNPSPPLDPAEPLLPELWRGVAIGAAVIIGVISGLILFNAVYWPFGIDDALAIYGLFGKSIALTGQLPRGALYENYPMLLPLSYAFTHQAAGWVDEHLAALIPALLSVGVLGAAYALGCELYNRAVGLTAALLIALTPSITYWSSASYADLPTAFYFGLATLFLIRHYRSRSWRDALLAGLFAGLAAWTKNSGLLIVFTLAGWLLYTQWRARFDLLRPPDRRDIALIVVGFLAVCAPWYLRTLLTAGVIVPSTGWTWAAQRTLFNLFPYLWDSRYLWLGWLFSGGLVFAIWQTWRARATELASTFLLICYVPFFVIWWALFSYEDRFLLVLIPFAAVMGAALAQVGLQRVGPPPLIQQPRLLAALLAFMIFLALPAASAAVLFKPEIVRRPLMSDADKHRVRVGGRYDMALYLQTLPVGLHLLTSDHLLPYAAYPANLTVGDVGNNLTPAQLAGYQYLILSPGESLPRWFRGGVPMYTAGGYGVYAIQPELLGR